MDRQTDGGDYNIPFAFLKKRGDNNFTYAFESLRGTELKVSF